jgi:hypothetical protein
MLRLSVVRVVALWVIIQLNTASATIVKTILWLNA